MDLMIQFRLVSTLDRAYVGSISFPLREVFSVRANFKQWLTVFDTIDDDIFDGTIGIDDDEKPRILVGFEIKDKLDDNDDSQQSSVNELSMTKDDRPQLRVGTNSEPRIFTDTLDLGNDPTNLRGSGKQEKQAEAKNPAKIYVSHEPVIKTFDPKPASRTGRPDLPRISVSPPKVALRHQGV
jgi:hypothetical protein